MATATFEPGTVERGFNHWLRSFVAMMRFDVLNMRTWLSFALPIQFFMGAGMAVMYSFYLGDIDPVAQLFIVTGIPALAMVPIGMLMVPGLIMTHKLRDTYDFIWSLPVPRSASAASTVTVFTALGIPGAAVALFIAWWYYDVPVAVSWAIAPAVLLVSLMSVSVGFALGHGIPEPRITNLIGNMIIFMVLLFSPIVVPIVAFPDWYAAIHEWLPFYHMSVVIRGGLSEGIVTEVGRSYAVLGAWTVASWALAAWVIGRRK